MMKTSASMRRLITDLPIPWKLGLVIGIFCVVIFGNLLVTYIGMEILSGSRAYVGGEGLWSKAEKGAIYRLTRYALYRDQADYQAYLTHISIPLGDHDARMAMEQPQMDMTRVSQGFVQGRNHPADVPIMAFMARRLNRFYYMGKALRIWAEADESIQQLPPVADVLHREIISGHPSPERIKAFLNDIQTIDGRLTPLEDDFSYTLGEGARWLKDVLGLIRFASTILFLAIALIVSYIISRHLCDEIDQLRRGASRIAAGDYSLTLDVESKDEIGDLARSFQQMAMERREAERLKDEFFANVSHELRTPLTLILSPLESLLSGDYGVVDQMVRQALETMHNNTIRLLQLVNGLLDFSKLEAGKLTVKREPVDIADLTEMVCHDFEPMMKSRHLQFKVGCEPRHVIVQMDRYLYERILFNLLSNAAKFTSAHGQIGVEMQWAEDRLLLTVSDTGIGIPAHELENIFERFRQVEGSSTRRFEGTGLGLALIKEFASLLDGTVSVKSTMGQGSLFLMSCSALRVASPDAVGTDRSRSMDSMRPQHYASPAPRAPRESEKREGLAKVLIAEDNAEMASYIDTLLSTLYETQIVRNGNEAMKAVRDFQPDLVLTDVMMPDRDGLSLCRELKANARTADIPVIMLTALTHREALLEGWKAGANEYLFKPFHPKELMTRVQSFLKAKEDRQKATLKIAQLNENVRRHMIDLTTANKELEAFSYSVSHDLRAPLRAIDGFSREILNKAGSALDDRSQSDLKRIIAAAKKMAQLIDDLLELSHLARRPLERQPVDLSQEAARLCRELQESDPSRTLEWIVSPGLVVDGDSGLLQIALDNLFKNSWKFTQRATPARIEFGRKKMNGANAFFIKDNGIGFNMEYAGKLFKPFQRLHDPHEFPGTGIGLALVWRIVHRHGGRIWVEAEEDRGATFYFTLTSDNDMEAMHERQNSSVG